MSDLPPTPDGDGQEEEVPTAGRDRADLARECELHPGSLVGSWFHKIVNEQIVWGGIIVAEPQPGVYLLEVEQGIADKASPQVVQTIKEMVATDEGYRFQFYDDREQMVDAYAEHVVNEEVI